MYARNKRADVYSVWFSKSMLPPCIKNFINFNEKSHKRNHNMISTSYFVSCKFSEVSVNINNSVDEYNIVASNRSVYQSPLLA